jgi:hypothetical protein
VGGGEGDPPMHEHERASYLNLIKGLYGKSKYNDYFKNIKKRRVQYHT